MSTAHQPLPVTPATSSTASTITIRRARRNFFERGIRILVARVTAAVTVHHIRAGDLEGVHGGAL
ncbi:hypothetical protein GCM10010440_22300 [Kitasatospora cinereorecta]